ncbi:MAG TPA: uracil-DNA glycosylase [Miltoncostaeaceae bacterium]|nr:uracil-DNA glycosylase [Miltoncostaeaceae bacterium]
MEAVERAAALERYHREQVVGCRRCALNETRTQVVVGAGSADAEVMFVGEAPGQQEDEQGVPFVGRAGRLLNELLGEIGLDRDAVFIANVLKCRPPGNRDPQADEIVACRPHLLRQVALIRPLLICSLGNFALRFFSGRPEGIGRVHGCPLPISVGDTPTLLYPLFHPAAALYARATRGLLSEDFARIPELLAQRRALGRSPSEGGAAGIQRGNGAESSSDDAANDASADQLRLM